MDKIYWENYYKKQVAPAEPSRFARFVMGQFVSSGQRLVELGCGNGRDANFFGENGVKVVAFDQATTEIEELNRANLCNNVTFRSGDFTQLENDTKGFDAVYSRFTLHSVDSSGQARALAWAARNLVDGGLLCVEVRGQKNSLFGKGEPVDGQHDAFIFNDHYRRFLNKDELDQQVMGLGFDIVSSEESKGFAPLGDEDDFFIRHVASK